MGATLGATARGRNPNRQHRCGSPPALRFLSATRSISQQAHCSIFLIGKELQPSALRARTTLTRTSSGATRGPISRPWRETEHAGSPSLVLVGQGCADAAPSPPADADAAPVTAISGTRLCHHATCGRGTAGRWRSVNACGKTQATNQIRTRWTDRGQRPAASGQRPAFTHGDVFSGASSTFATTSFAIAEDCRCGLRAAVPDPAPNHLGRRHQRYTSAESVD